MRPEENPRARSVLAFLTEPCAGDAMSRDVTSDVTPAIPEASPVDPEASREGGRGRERTGLSMSRLRWNQWMVPALALV